MSLASISTMSRFGSRSLAMIAVHNPVYPPPTMHVGARRSRVGSLDRRQESPWRTLPVCGIVVSRPPRMNDLDALGFPLDGVSLLPWLVEGAEYPEHDLFWRVSSQGALRRGKFKFVIDQRDKALMGSWPRPIGVTRHLYDFSGDGREAADIARHHPDLVAELHAEWNRVNNELLDYPPGHRGLPRRASATQPAISQPD